MKALLLILAWCVSVSLLHAQKNNRASDIINNLSKQYKSYKSMQAAFTLTIENQKEQTTEQQKGILTLKGDKYRVELANQDIISNGTVIWTHLKEEKEVQINANDKNNENEFSPNRIFNFSQAGFRSRLGPTRKTGKTTIQTVELIPEHATAKPYFKILLQIDRDNNHLHSVKIFNKSGIHITYTIDRFIPNIDAPDVLFSFDPGKHKDVEVIDLR
jgi:outer membrane lipoprotein-sorting protein